MFHCKALSLGVEPGQKLVVDKLPDGRIQVKAAATGNIADAFGTLKRKGGPSLSVARMKAIVSSSRGSPFTKARVSIAADA